MTCGARRAAPLGALLLAPSLLVGGCVSETRPGLEVTLTLGVGAPAEGGCNAAAALPEFEDVNGERVTFSALHVALGGAELVPCAADALLHRTGELLVPVARAHSETTPTRLGTPLVVDVLDAEARALPWGTLRPPPRRYCALRVSALPADEDAQYAPGDGAMLGRTLRGAGVRAAGDEALELSSTAAFDVDLPLDAALLDAGDQVTLHVCLARGNWLEGGDLEADSRDDLARAALGAVRAGLRVTGTTERGAATAAEAP